MKMVELKQTLSVSCVRSPLRTLKAGLTGCGENSNERFQPFESDGVARIWCPWSTLKLLSWVALLLEDLCLSESCKGIGDVSDFDHFVSALVMFSSKVFILVIQGPRIPREFCIPRSSLILERHCGSGSRATSKVLESPWIPDFKNFKNWFLEAGCRVLVRLVHDVLQPPGLVPMVFMTCDWQDDLVAFESRSISVGHTLGKCGCHTEVA